MQIQSEKERLEQENKAMEERLEALRVTLQKQRDARGGETTWSSGRKGALNSHVTKVLQETRSKRATGNVKYKILNTAGLSVAHLPTLSKGPPQTMISSPPPLPYALLRQSNRKEHIIPRLLSPS